MENHSDFQKLAAEMKVMRDNLVLGPALKAV